MSDDLRSSELTAGRVLTSQRLGQQTGGTQLGLCQLPLPCLHGLVRRSRCVVAALAWSLSLLHTRSHCVATANAMSRCPPRSRCSCQRSRHSSHRIDPRDVRRASSPLSLLSARAIDHSAPSSVKDKLLLLERDELVDLVALLHHDLHQNCFGTPSELHQKTHWHHLQNTHTVLRVYREERPARAKDLSLSIWCISLSRLSLSKCKNSPTDGFVSFRLLLGHEITSPLAHQFS